MNIIRYLIRSFFTNEYYLIIRFASKRLFVATLKITLIHNSARKNIFAFIKIFVSLLSGGYPRVLLRLHPRDLPPCPLPADIPGGQDPAAADQPPHLQPHPPLPATDPQNHPRGAQAPEQLPESQVGREIMMKYIFVAE